MYSICKLAVFNIVKKDLRRIFSDLAQMGGNLSNILRLASHSLQSPFFTLYVRVPLDQAGRGFFLFCMCCIVLYMFKCTNKRGKPKSFWRKFFWKELFKILKLIYVYFPPVPQFVSTQLNSTHFSFTPRNAAQIRSLSWTQFVQLHSLKSTQLNSAPLNLPQYK